jgi:hypothetical protein
MLRTTARQQLRRTNSAKGYVAARCYASAVAVTSVLGLDPTRLGCSTLGRRIVRSKHSPVGEIVRLCYRRVAGVPI